MRPLSVMLTIGLFAAPLLAQNDARGRAATKEKVAPQPPRTGVITGTVMCGDTRRPARGAMVLVTGVPPPAGKEAENATRSSEAMTRVASDGTFTAPHLAAGEYSVIVMLPGYLSLFDTVMETALADNSPDKMRDMLRKAGTLQVSATGAAHTDITLQRGAAVSGRVLYTDGSPATQVMLDIQNISAPPRKPGTGDPEELMMMSMVRTIFTHQSQSTDDQGHFRIAGLAPGKYRVAAVEASAEPLGGMGEEAGFAAMLGGSRPSDLHIFSGDTLHRKDAKVYELRSGDEVTGIDITIPTEAFHRVSGRLAGKDGRNINSAKLLLTDAADDTLVFNATPARDGAFMFAAVPAGTYNLSASEARILDVPQDYPENMPVRYGKITNAFGDATVAVIVKDSDVPDVRLPLTEVPVPAGANDHLLPGAPPDL